MIDFAKLQGLGFTIIGLVLIFCVAIPLGIKAGKAKNSEAAKTVVNTFFVAVIVALGLASATFGLFGRKLLQMVGVDI